MENDDEKKRLLKENIHNIFLKGDRSFWRRAHKCPAKKTSGKSYPTLREYVGHMLGKCSSKKIIIFVDTDQVEIVADFVSEHLLVLMKASFKKHEKVRLQDTDLIETNQHVKMFSRNFKMDKTQFWFVATSQFEASKLQKLATLFTLTFPRT